MKKRVTALLLVLVCTAALCSCDAMRAFFGFEVSEDRLVGNEVSVTDYGFVDDATGIEYVMFSNPISVYALEIGDPYCNDGISQYYEIPWQDPSEYLCDENGWVYRASDLPDISMKSFSPVSAFVYYGSVYLTTLYCEEKYRDDSVSYPDDTVFDDDSELIYAIRDAVIYGDSVELPTELNDENTFYIRMLSPEYPGLYYVVMFTQDNDGVCYLYDRASRTAVIATDSIVREFLGND